MGGGLSTGGARGAAGDGIRNAISETMAAVTVAAELRSDTVCNSDTQTTARGWGVEATGADGWRGKRWKVTSHVRH